jgi:glutathione S-transferase
MYTLYSMQRSANSYKARLALNWIEARFDLVDVDVLAGENRTPNYLALNPAGQVPILALPDGRLLPESGAILHYLAEGTPLLPDERFARAEVLRWMFFEQHAHDPFIGQARYWLSLVRGGRELKQNLIEEWEDRGYEALRVMDAHLGGNAFFAGEQPTLADLALYANTHAAGDAGFALDPFGNVRDWIGRMEGQARHVGIDWRPGDGAVAI